MIKYPFDMVAEIDAVQTLKMHYDWIKQVGMKGTPSLFLNGYQLPSEYDIADLKVMLPELADETDQLVYC
jgi:protein-disulfide isomerase